MCAQGVFWKSCFLIHGWYHPKIIAPHPHTPPHSGIYHAAKQTSEWLFGWLLLKLWKIHWVEWDIIYNQNCCVIYIVLNSLHFIKIGFSSYYARISKCECVKKVVSVRCVVLQKSLPWQQMHNNGTLHHTPLCLVMHTLVLRLSSACARLCWAQLCGFFPYAFA